MRIKPTFIAIAALAVFFLAIIMFRENTSFTYIPLSAADRQILAWVPYWDQEAALNSVTAHSNAFDYVGLFWFALNKNGQIEVYPYAKADSKIVSDLQQRGIKVLMVIANLPTENEGGDWDHERVRLVLGSRDARKSHINDILRVVNQYGFDGVNIDYEALKADQKQDFTLFIRDLARQLHRQDKLLGVSLHPKPRENDPQFSNGSQAQDWRLLGRYADQLYLMNYEQHWASSPPGPAASLPWVRSITAYAARKIPRNKLYAGIPLYGYDWPQGESAKGLTYTDVQQLQATYQIEPQWDADEGSWHFTYRDEEGQAHDVWYEDARSFQAKKDLYEQMGIVHLAFWRLGNEDGKAWAEILTQ